MSNTCVVLFFMLQKHILIYRFLFLNLLSMLSLLSLLSIRLTDHIFHNDIKDFTNRIAIL